MIPFILMSVIISFLLKIKAHQTFDLYQKMTVGDFEENNAWYILATIMRAEYLPLIIIILIKLCRKPLVKIRYILTHVQFFSGKKRSPRSRGMSTISQFVKFKQSSSRQFSSILVERLQPLHIQMRSASLLLLIMFISWVLASLSTLTVWGKLIMTL